MMKKSIILLLTLFCIFTLVSCFDFDNDNGAGQGDQNGDSKPQESAFWTPGTPIYMVFNPEIDRLPPEIDSALFDHTGSASIYVGETREEGDHEIIIGDTSRALSRMAKNRLDDIAISKELSGYVIYSDGMSVAIVYSDDESLTLAVNDFIANHLVPKDNKISFNEGVVSEYSYDLYKHYDEMDAAMREEYWSNLKAYVDGLGFDGDETVTAFKKLYSLYKDSAYLWLANLYDPVTGGFYYSNSGRDTVGFAPDLESTRQALDFLRYSGMTSSLKTDLPKEIQTAIVEFVRGLYDSSSGLYYHPQWSHLVTTDERLGRDYTNAKTILSAFGAKQTKAVSALTMPMAASVAYSASFVVATASPAHLQSEEAFLEYLNSQNWKDSYTAGNRIAAQSALIAQAGLMDVCLDFLDEKQYPETGMWAPTRDDYAVNGFLKISGIYLDAGRPIKYAKEAADTCIAVLKSELKPTTVCWVYNVWFSLANIIRNLNGSKSTAEDKALAVEIRSTLRQNAAEYIDIATAKYLPFVKDDGSFSYTPTRTSDMSQGMPVAVYNTNEGDVNASYISIISVPSRIFEALGYGKYEVPIYTKNDMKVFVDAISEVGEVVKTNTEHGGPLEFNGESLEGLFHSFTGVEIDTEPADLFGKGYAYAFVDDDNGENVLHFGKTDVSVGFEPYICFIVRERKGTRYIYETKIKLDSGSVTDGGWFTKFSMYYNNGRFWQMFGYIGDDGKLLLDDPEKPLATLELGEWYTLRFEYYTDSAELPTEKICRVYVNGEYVGNGGASGLAGEDKGISKTLIELSDGAVDVSYMLDDVNMTTDDVTYSSVTGKTEAGDTEE